MKPPNYYGRILVILHRLKELYPTYNMGRHLSTILEGEDIWGVTDHALLMELQRYKKQLELDCPHGKEDIDEIINGGMNLYNCVHDEIENTEDGDY
jgi:hypothetical protein